VYTNGQCVLNLSGNNEQLDWEKNIISHTTGDIRKERIPYRI